MNKKKILKKFEDVNQTFDSQKKAIKQDVIDFSKKQIEELKREEELFEENMTSGKTYVETMKQSLSYKPEVDRDDLFLFSEASKKDTFNAQLSLLNTASSHLKNIHSLEDLINSTKNIAQTNSKTLNEFKISINIKDLKNVKNLSQFALEIAKTQVERLAAVLDLPTKTVAENFKKFLLETLKKFNDLPNFVAYASLYSGTSYEELQKMVPVLNKYNIKNYITSDKSNEIIDKNNVVKQGVDNVSKISVDAEKSIEKKFSVKKFFKNLAIFLAVALACVCIPTLDRIEIILKDIAVFKEYENLIIGLLPPVLLVLIIASIISRCTLKSSKKRKLNKCGKYCDELVEKYFEKEHKLRADMGNEYYEFSKVDYFERKKNYIAKIYNFADYLTEQLNESKQTLVENYSGCLPLGLLENERLLDTIIKVMKEGRASDYKEARVRAEEIIDRENATQRQEEYLAEKAKKDDAQRKKVLDSQRRMEEYAERQAEYAREQAAEARRSAEAQEKAAEYARNTAKNSEKLLEMEEQRNRTN